MNRVLKAISLISDYLEETHGDWQVLYELVHQLEYYEETSYNDGFKFYLCKQIMKYDGSKETQREVLEARLMALASGDAALIRIIETMYEEVTKS